MNESSQLNFISTRPVYAETHFGLLSEHCRTGEAQLNVDLASVATGIDIRNERMQPCYLMFSHFLAEITTDFDLGEFTSLRFVVKTISPNSA